MKKSSTKQYTYEIRVEGALGTLCLIWFEGLNFRREPAGQGMPAATVIFGEIKDQPALHGVLNKIRDLNLALISVIRVEKQEK